MSEHITVTERGGYTTYRGDRYDRSRHPNETAKLVRRDIRDAVKAGDLPDMKYSVRRGYGWRDLNVTVLEDPETWALVDQEDDLLSDPWSKQRRVLSPQALRVGTAIALIGARYMKVTRDIQTDYHQGGLFRVYANAVPGGGLVLG